MAVASRKPATFEDLAGCENAEKLEIVAGELVEKAIPSAEHSETETKLIEAFAPFNRKPGGRLPGGWWIRIENHVGYEGDIYCHDAAGWRRDRIAARPTGWPVRERPDWVCEIVSPRHEKHDLVDKPRTLHRAAVPHYWVLDPVAKILLVHRWAGDGYLVVQRAAAGEVIRAEPFEAVELRVGVLFGDDED